MPRWGRKERSFVAALLLHFHRAALLSHPLDSTYPATNDQLIENVGAENLESKQFRRLKEKFISQGNQPATKMELLLCVREGYRFYLRNFSAPCAHLVEKFSGGSSRLRKLPEPCFRSRL